MEQLIIKGKTKEEAIKEINKFRLANKNKWYQVELELGRHKYKMKIYNTWAQISRKYFLDTMEFIHDYPSGMDLKVNEFKNYLNEYLNR